MTRPDESVEIVLPDGVEWPVWRLLTSDKFRIPYPGYLDSHWSWIDGMNALAVLDAIGVAEKELAQKAKRNAD